MPKTRITNRSKLPKPIQTITEKRARTFERRERYKNAKQAEKVLRSYRILYSDVKQEGSTLIINLKSKFGVIIKQKPPRKGGSISVRSHARKGTRGVRAHTRNRRRKIMGKSFMEKLDDFLQLEVHFQRP